MPPRGKLLILILVPPFSAQSCGWRFRRVARWQAGAGTFFPPAQIVWARNYVVFGVTNTGSSAGLFRHGGALQSRHGGVFSYEREFGEATPKIVCGR